MSKLLNCTFGVLLLCMGVRLPATPVSIDPGHYLPSPDQLVCTLPPPANFTVVEQGPTWVKLTWSHVPSAFGYHLITTELSTGFVVEDVVIPVTSVISNTWTVNGMAPSSQYETRIWSVCSDGQDGPEYNSAYSETIIIELVDVGYVPAGECLQDGCEMKKPGDQCVIPWQPSARTYFRIKSPAGANHYFMVETPGNVAKIYPQQNQLTGFSFEQESGEFIRIYFNGIALPVARLTAIRFSTFPEGALMRKGKFENNPNFPIYRLDPCSNPEPPRGINFENTPLLLGSSPEVLVLSPNPFRDEAEVTVSFGGEQNRTMLRLYDLHGRQVLELPMSESRCQLPVAALPPGIYFLRAESGQSVKTIKVVKTNE